MSHTDREVQMRKFWVFFPKLTRVNQIKPRISNQINFCRNMIFYHQVKGILNDTIYMCTRHRRSTILGAYFPKQKCKYICINKYNQSYQIYLYN
jgi:hypothetical protein